MEKKINKEHSPLFLKYLPFYGELHHGESIILAENSFTDISGKRIIDEKLFDILTKNKAELSDKGLVRKMYLCNEGINVGDIVVKNPDTWIENEFDSWGRGIGDGEVVAIYPDIDVRWPEGKCYEDRGQIIVKVGEVSPEFIVFAKDKMEIKDFIKETFVRTKNGWDNEREGMEFFDKREFYTIKR